MNKNIIKEISIDLIIIIACGLLSFFLSKIIPLEGLTQIIKLEYSSDSTKVISIALRDVVLALLCFLVNQIFFLFAIFGFNKNAKGFNKKNWLFYGILSFFGLLAFILISSILINFRISREISFLITGGIVTIYNILNYKLYFEDYANSNKLFWEIYRFALVGLIAAVFDFVVCYISQFIAFNNSSDWYVTLISVTCGFIIGVTINYFLSTYMVYKASKSNISKTVKGLIIFVILSAIGLGLGIGIQYLLYDFLHVQKGIAFLSYPIDFVIRTLVVMIYNYVSRKLIIYR